MKLIETSLPDVVVLEPLLHVDNRGFFLETYREDSLQQAGISEHFVQENQSRSTYGVLRGLHYQQTQPQGKLVRVARGKLFDVVVDVRKGSPNFGQWYGTTLDEESMRMIYIPAGFAHGFVVLSDIADIIYKCTDYYHPESEQGILWNDPDINIEWPITDVQLSEKDSNNRILKDLPASYLPSYPGKSS